MTTRIVPLTCPACQAELGPEVTAVAFSCPGCRKTWTLTAEGLEAQPVRWAAEKGQAWWRIPATKISLGSRLTFSGNAGPDPRWPELDAFWIPAFETDFRKARQLAIDRTFGQEPPVVREDAGLLGSCQLGEDDARRLCEVVAITVEANRGDQLRSVDIQLELGTPELWVL